MQRDPAAYVDGANLREYGRSSPPGVRDPSGNWAVDRSGRPTALAISGKHAGDIGFVADPVADLADKIGLDASDVAKWLGSSRGPVVRTLRGDKRVSELVPSDKICPFEIVFIPNTVLAYWAGNWGSSALCVNGHCGLPRSAGRGSRC